MEQITDQNAVSLTTRNADLSSMVELLRTQQAAKTDHVVAASALAALGGQMLVHGAGIELSMDGVTTSDLTLTPTRTADNGIADKLGIPAAYLRRTREQNIDLYDANVNGWLTHQPERRFLVRGLADGDGRHGVMRALLSDRYRPIENLDVLMTCLDGIRGSRPPRRHRLGGPVRVPHVRQDPLHRGRDHGPGPAHRLHLPVLRGPRH